MSDSRFMYIEPDDSLFFRTGKPFNMGEDSWTDSSLLPNPSVIWGAIYSKLIMDNNLEFNETTDKEFEKSLTIKNIFIYNRKENTALLPAPMDLFIDNDGNVYDSYLEDSKNFISSTKFSKVIAPKKNIYALKDVNELFINIKYLNQTETNFKLTKINTFIDSEKKVGIKINKNKRNSEEKHLYRIDLSQFKENWGFLVEYTSNKDLMENGYLKLGGEGKATKYDIIREPRSIKRFKSFNYNKNNDYLKIYFKTDAVIKDSLLKANKLFIATSIIKQGMIGGFDMRNKIPKKMYKTLPAGSILILERSNIDEVIEFLNNNLIEGYKGSGLYEIYNGE